MASGVCPFRLTRPLLYHTLLTALLLIVVAGQGIVLDVFIIAHFSTLSVNYFWLLPDFLLIFGFVAAMSEGYNRCKAERTEDNRSPVHPRLLHAAPIHRPSLRERLIGTYALPVYVWVAYSVILVAKVAVIFRDEIPNTINPDDFLSPQLLKVALSATAIVFGLLVEGQVIYSGTNLGDVNSREAYVRVLSHGTALETLDSVTFLSLLIQSDSNLVLPLVLEQWIIGLACINFLLPGLALVKLSHSTYGRDKAGHVCSLLYKLSHLCLTNFTFFIIRVYLWAGLSASISPFIVKNVYHFCTVMREIYEDGHQMCAQYMVRRRLKKSCRRHHAHSANSGAVAFNLGAAALNSGATELSVMEPSAGCGANGDKFEEIDLKQNDSPSTNQ